MALLKFKRSAVPAKVPSIADLNLGELALNTYDGKVYIKKDNGTQSIVEIGASAFITDPISISSGAGLYLEYISGGALGSYDFDTGTWQIMDYGASQHSFYINGSGPTMRINSAGNVGIGTTVPADRLDVIGAIRIRSSNSLRLNNGSNNSLSEIYNNGASGAGNIQINVAGSERMRIDGSGNLLVGTTTSFGKLSVFGTAGFNADANSSISGSGSYKFRGAAAGTTITTYDYLNYTAMQFIRDNGNPTNTVGSITCTDTATAYNTSSDYRLKDIDGPIANSGAYLDALKPVQGSWKSNGSRFIGLLAHEVQEVSETPIATGEKDGEEMQAMDYSAPEIIANLIAEIQSLRARVAQLEGN